MTDNPGKKPVHLFEEFRAFHGLQKVIPITADMNTRKCLRWIAWNHCEAHKISFLPEDKTLLKIVLALELQPNIKELFWYKRR